MQRRRTWTLRRAGGDPNQAARASADEAHRLSLLAALDRSLRPERPAPSADAGLRPAPQRAGG